jgi:ATP-binding cassette, subfamily B, bacterial MsbA
LLALPVRWRHICGKFMFEFFLKLWDLAKNYRSRLYLGVLAGILNGLMPALLMATIMFVYEAAFPSAQAESPVSKLPQFAQNWFNEIREALETGVRTHLWAIVVLIASIPAIMLLRGLFGFLNVYCLQWVASRSIADLRARLFRHLLDLSAGFYNQTSSGQLISRVINDTGTLQVLLSNSVAVIVRDPVTLISTVGYLLYMNARLTLITVVVLPACLIPIIIFNKKIRRSSKEMQARSADLTQIMTEAFTGYRIVKAYNLEDIVTVDFQNTTRGTVGHYMRVVRASNITGPSIEFFGSCGVALLLAYVVYDQKPISNFISLVGGVFFMYAPIKNLNMLFTNLTTGRAASERVFELLATPNTVPEPAHPKTLNASNADITFENLGFSYGEKTVLQDINLTIKSGRLVALVGPSGSGKTTLANLLLRFYDPKEGVIRIGGVDIRDVSTSDLRNQIAVVSQEVILFNETIRRNIELGRPGASNEEIIAAARHAYAYDFIMEKPQGFDARIGEKGVLLSGGQRQRIAIARAVLRNAPILILDEATSALDNESERIVQKTLDELMKGRTTLCIAHRLSTILHADLIVVFDQGRIVETGKHEELIQRGGIYQKLYLLSEGGRIP